MIINLKQASNRLMMSVNRQQQQEITNYLAGFISEHKKNKIEEILNKRTRYLTVAFENVYQSHNASAALRSCECFGIQDAHIIEKNNSFKPNSDCLQGSAKWLTIKKHPHTDPDNLENCIRSLRDGGYHIAATTLREGSIPIQGLFLEKKTALFFGTEKEGLSEEVHRAADTLVQIPMRGFTQSFNLSVGVALCLYELTKRLSHLKEHRGLSSEEKDTLRLEWYTRTVHHGDLLIKKYLDTQQV
ncbi:MAG: RNA methyltransferase [Deltaproteobacteria bacterium]|nr:RNA methyltransferase [Deltaproteobacteria bacterium]